jgi:hypothetical protein
MVVAPNNALPAIEKPARASLYIISYKTLLRENIGIILAYIKAIIKKDFK